MKILNNPCGFCRVREIIQDDCCKICLPHKKELQEQERLNMEAHARYIKREIPGFKRVGKKYIKI